MRTRETCIPGGPVDYWRNSGLGIDLNVILGATFLRLGHEVPDCRLIEVSHSKPDPRLFDIPAGFTVGDSRK
jgi:hypothetical protein